MKSLKIDRIMLTKKDQFIEVKVNLFKFLRQTLKAFLISSVK